MKKYILFLLCLFLLSGCTFIKKEENIQGENKKEEVIKENQEYQDDNSIKLGLFLYDNNYSNKKRLEDTYYTSFVNGEDIGSFEVFLTDDEIINGSNFKNTWYKYYNMYENIDNYKVGFNIKFILEDGNNFSANFLEPDIYKFGEYFYVYLYDDINQEDNSFYSHLENMEENTVLTSIKIYAVSGIDRVQNIVLSAFTYDSADDFDENGNYRGNSLYVIRIKRNS